MSEWILSALSCFGLGIMTTLHPCPLTSNLAAISLLNSWFKTKKSAAVISLLFVGGYLSSYLLISIGLASGILSIPNLSFALQKIIATLLGPVLILVGMVLADLMGRSRFQRGRLPKWIMHRENYRYQAFPLGALLALSFCPATAALFFGVLIPLAIRQGEVLLFPLIYAVGVSLPLLLLSFVIHRGGTKFLPESWQNSLPVGAGWILIVIGIYLTIENVYLV